MYENIIAEMLERIAKLTAEVEKLKKAINSKPQDKPKGSDEAPLKLKWNTPKAPGSKKQREACAINIVKARAAKAAKRQARLEAEKAKEDKNNADS